MSIEMENPKTIVEQVDAAANLVEQMRMAVEINDKRHFAKCHAKASKFLFDALRQLEEKGID